MDENIKENLIGFKNQLDSLITSLTEFSDSIKDNEDFKIKSLNRRLNNDVIFKLKEVLGVDDLKHNGVNSPYTLDSIISSFVTEKEKTQNLNEQIKRIKKYL